MVHILVQLSKYIMILLFLIDLFLLLERRFRMTKQNHKTGFLVAVMVFCAIILRVLGKFDILKVPGGILRSLIYIAIKPETAIR